MLNKDQIREFTFRNYDDFISFAKSKFSSLVYKGIPAEELVNEAIINVFDVKLPFEDEAGLVNFIKGCIKGCGYNELENIKDSNYLTKVSNSKEEYSLLDKEIKEGLPQEHFSEIYSIFEKARFGLDNEKRLCQFCGFNDFYIVARRNTFKCKACHKPMSLTSRTYLANTKLKYSILYKMIILIYNRDVSGSHQLGRLLRITQKTAYNKSFLIRSVIMTLKEVSVYNILYKLLSNMDADEQGLYYVPKNVRKYSNTDIVEIRRLYDQGINTVTEIGVIFGVDYRDISSIVNRKIYKKVKNYG